MSEYLEYLSGVAEKTWGSSGYQWFFYLGILLVLLMEKRRSVRIVLGWFPLLFLAVIYNPLFAGLLNLFVNGNLSAYVSRFFTFIPMLYVMAYGVLLLLSRMKDSGKFLCVCLVSGVIVLSGNSMYRQGWMHPAENPEKVPRNAEEIVSILRNEMKKDLCVAAPPEIAVYLRQLDAELTTPYTRSPNKLGKAMSKQPPNPVRVMTLAGKQAVDVVVVWNRDEVRTVFAEAGWEPFTETASCLLYRVSGVPRVTRTLDEKRRVASETMLDEEGNPAVGEKGYVSVLYEYNDAGEMIRQSYYDASGQPMRREGKKYASMEYIDDGEAKILVRYYDTEGNLTKEKRKKK